MRTTFKLLTRVYQFAVSSLLHQALLWPGGCRFSPTCSDYGLEAVRQYGLAAGFVLLVKRVTRCRPGRECGYDPVPPNPRGFSN